MFAANGDQNVTTDRDPVPLDLPTVISSTKKADAPTPATVNESKLVRPHTFNWFVLVDDVFINEAVIDVLTAIVLTFILGIVDMTSDTICILPDAVKLVVPVSTLFDRLRPAPILIFAVVNDGDVMLVTVKSVVDTLLNDALFTVNRPHTLSA